MILSDASTYRVRLAESPDDLRAAQRLRYQVFVDELGGDGALVDHGAGLECDALDPFADHLLLEEEPNGRIIGVYRLMLPEQAARAGGYYSSGEYDLAHLLRSGRRLLELGRSCLHPDARGGNGMHLLWSALADYVAQHRIDVLFGVASFHGTDVESLAQPLSLLHHRHLAPAELRVRANPQGFHRMDLIPPERIDRKDALLSVPSLIKAYLRLGGTVGEGAYVDTAFNTTDVCLIMDTAALSARQARIYGGGRG